MVVMPFRPPRTAVTRQGFDAAYLQRLAEGDLHTEQHFAAYFGELVLIKARARRLPQALAEDVRQETLLRVLRTLRSPEGLRCAEALGAFVNSTCNNVLHERYRDQTRYQQTDDEATPPVVSDSPSPEDQVLIREREEAVRLVLERMSPAKSRLLRDVLLSERDRDEVCREHHVTRDSLRVLLHRAKQEFREIYLDNEKTTAAARRIAAGTGGGGRLGSAPQVRPARRAVEL